ncbi:MAG: tetratricopeptide repeat protein [Promethearchaeota archaeon]
MDPSNIKAKDYRDELKLEIKLDSVPFNAKNKASKLFEKGNKQIKKKPKFEEAINFFEEASKLNPYDTQILMSLGNTYENLGKFEEAKKCYQEILSLNPKDTPAAEKLRSLNNKMEN